MWVAAFLMGQRVAGKAAGMAPVSQLAPSALDRQLAELERRTERLMLVSEAMWEILAEDGHTEEELIARVEAVQRRHEAAANRVVACAGCGARLLPGDARCQTCGVTTDSLAPPGLGGVDG